MDKLYQLITRNSAVHKVLIETDVREAIRLLKEIVEMLSALISKLKTEN